MLFIKPSTVLITAKAAIKTALSWDLAPLLFPGTLAIIFSSSEDAMPKIEYFNTTCEIVVLSHCVAGAV